MSEIPLQNVVRPRRPTGPQFLSQEQIWGGNSHEQGPGTPIFETESRFAPHEGANGGHAQQEVMPQNQEAGLSLQEQLRRQREAQLLEEEARIMEARRSKESKRRSLQRDVDDRRKSLISQMGKHERRESVAYQVHDERRYRLLQGKEIYAITPLAFTEDTTNDEGRTRRTRVPHLEGIRGVLAIQTLLYIFFRVFCPGVVDADIVDAPRWTMYVRKVLSPLLFDGSLQAAAYMLLLGRVSLLTYLERREAIDLAGPCFRRPFRLLIPAAITLAITSGLVAGKGFAYAQYMADHLNNPAVQPPPIWGSTLEYFNALASLFFSPYAYTNSRAVTFLQPAGISWYLIIAFQQIYVLIIFAWTLPYTVLRYKVIGLTALILLSAWVGRWSWYTVTGLAIAEFSVAYRQTLHPKPRVTIASKRVPLYLFPLALFAIGVMFKYLWAGLPYDADNELVFHADLNTAKLDWNAPHEHKAIPRYDNYLVCVGLLGLIELSHTARRILGWKPFTYLGRLGFSIALIAGTIMVSLGSVVYYCLVESLGFAPQGASTMAVLFFIFVPLSLVCADIYSRVVDDGSLWASRALFHFFRT